MKPLRIDIDQRELAAIQPLDRQDIGHDLAGKDGAPRAHECDLGCFSHASPPWPGNHVYKERESATQRRNANLTILPNATRRMPQVALSTRR